MPFDFKERGGLHLILTIIEDRELGVYELLAEEAVAAATLNRIFPPCALVLIDIRSWLERSCSACGCLLLKTLLALILISEPSAIAPKRK
jgi:hypothetical protein